MIELYIENQKIDITDDIEIGFTYETIDPDKLSSIKNSFSKTVNIPGTPNNNKLFGYIFRNDKYIRGLDIANIGDNYDPHKKVNWFINKNGALYNRGYCTLDSIETKNDYEVTYKITLYGGLGEFFYSLSYNEDGSPKTLEDLYWNWQTAPIGLQPMDGTNPNAFIPASNDIWQLSNRYLTKFYDISDPNIKYIEFVGTSKVRTGIIAILKDIDNIEEGAPVQYATGSDRTYIYQGEDRIIDKPSDAKYIWMLSFDNNTSQDFSINIYKLSSTTIENEKDNILYVASAYNVAQSYSKLNPFATTEGTTPIYTDVIFVPCYQGLYEDFDSKSMLVSTRMQNDTDFGGYIASDTKSRLLTSFPDSFTKSEQTFTTLNSDLNNEGLDKFGLVKISRDIDPWEAGELRVKEMPIAIRLSKLMAAISNPVNNGGYNVEWDESIKATPYWNYSWIMLSTLKQEKGELERYDIDFLTTQPTSINYNYELQDSNSTTFIGRDVFDKYVDQGGYSYTINYNPRLTFPVADSFIDMANYQLVDSLCVYNDRIFLKNVYVLVTKVAIDDVYKYAVADVFFINNSNTYTITNYEVDALKTTIASYIGDSGQPLEVKELIVHNLHSVVRAYIGSSPTNVTLTLNDVQISHNIEIMRPSKVKLRHEQMICWVKSIVYTPTEHTTTAGTYGTNARPSMENDNMRYFLNIPSADDPNNSAIWPAWSTADAYTLYLAMDTSELNVFNQINGAKFRKTEIYKKDLFANSESPMRYLSGFTKLMNYRYICDETTKTIYIKDLKNYYDGKIFDLTDRVDLGRGITITPVTAKYKNISIGLDTPETYPVNIFNKNSKDKFNTLKYVTNVEYPIADSTLLNDLVYNNTIDWQQSSIFYNIIPQFSKGYNTPTISWNLFNKTSTGNEYDIKTEQEFTIGVQSYVNNLVPYVDPLPKVSLFNKENKIEDIGASLIFLNGFVKNYDYSQVTQGNQTMKNEVYPTEIMRDHYINRAGAIKSATNQSVSLYPCDPTRTYYATVLRSINATGSSNRYYINIGFYYYNDNDELTFISGVQRRTIYSRSQHMAYDYRLTVPANATIIAIANQSIADEVTTRLKVDSTTSNIISPRVILTNDTYEQYYLNQERCYQWDFSYSKKFYKWGYSSEELNGSATSWVMPMFTKDLYNTYSNEAGWQTSQTKVASWNFIMQDGLDKLYTPIKTDFLKSQLFDYYVSIDNIKQIQNNEYNISEVPADDTTTRIYNTKWSDYLDDLYDRNARDIVAYIDLNGFGTGNDIMRHIYTWKGHRWIITKLDNFKTGYMNKDKFTKVLLHKINHLTTWTNNV